MDPQHVMDAVRKLEVERSVTATHLARALESTIASVQGIVDVLVATGALRTSTMQCRPHAGADFTTRAVWYHTPEREVTARFGAIFDPIGPRDEASRADAPMTTMAS